MAILSDRGIKERLASGELSIKPFVEKNLSPNGYDMSIEEILLPDAPNACDGGVPVRSGSATLKPLTRALVSTCEYIQLGPRLTAQLWIRTSWGRRGILAIFGKVDAGFKGTLTLPIFNTSSKSVDIPIGERFAQIVFEALESEPEALYEKRSGNYQGQHGVTLAKEGEKNEKHKRRIK